MDTTNNATEAIEVLSGRSAPPSSSGSELCVSVSSSLLTCLPLSSGLVRVRNLSPLAVHSFAACCCLLAGGEAEEADADACAGPVQALLRMGDIETLRNLAEIMAPSSERSAGKVSSVLQRVDVLLRKLLLPLLSPYGIPLLHSSQATLLPDPETLTFQGTCGAGLPPVPLAAGRRACASYLLSGGSVSAKSLLHCLLSVCPSVDEAAFSGVFAGLGEAVADSLPADNLTGIASCFQVEALLSSFVLPARFSQAVDGRLSPVSALLTQARGLFHISPSVRKSSALAFADVEGFDPAARAVEAWEGGGMGYVPPEAAADVPGLSKYDIRSLVSLVATSGDEDVRMTAAAQLADAVLSDPAVPEYMIEEGMVDGLFGQVLEWCKVGVPRLALSTLLKAAVWTFEGCRSSLLADGGSFGGLVAAAVKCADAEVQAELLAAVHRAAFEPAIFLGRGSGRPDEEVEADLELARSALPAGACVTPVSARVATAFVLIPGLYAPTTFVRGGEEDEALRQVYEAVVDGGYSTEERARDAADAIANSMDGKEMLSAVNAAHTLALVFPGVAAALAKGGRVLACLHRVLSVPPSSTRDHELLTESLRLISAVMAEMERGAIASAVNSMARISVPLLDVTNVTPSMAADGVDSSGLSRVKSRYSDLSAREEKRRERRGRRAVRALWSARTEMLVFLFGAVTSGAVGRETVLHLVTKTHVPRTLTKHYMCANFVENSNVENFTLTSRAQSNAISLLHVLLDDGGGNDGLSSFFASEAKDGSTYFDLWIPSLIGLATKSSRLPDSFQGKGVSRSAALMLKTVSSCVCETKTTTERMGLISSKRQIKEKENWCGGGSGLGWTFKLLADREAVVRSAGFGVCADLLNLAWARPMIMSKGDENGEDEDEGGDEEPFYRFSTSILEMACRVASDDSESPIVRSECLGLLYNACCVGGAAFTGTNDVLDVIPSIGRMLSRAAAQMGDVKGDVEDESTKASDAMDDIEEERRARADKLLLPTPTLLWACIKLLRCLLAGVYDSIHEDVKSDGAVAGEPESPNNSLDSSFIQDGEVRSCEERETRAADARSDAMTRSFSLRLKTHPLSLYRVLVAARGALLRERNLVPRGEPAQERRVEEDDFRLHPCTPRGVRGGRGGLRPIHLRDDGGRVR